MGASQHSSCTSSVAEDSVLEMKRIIFSLCEADYITVAHTSRFQTICGIASSDI
jgi:hypothetical protein